MPTLDYNRSRRNTIPPMSSATRNLFVCSLCQTTSRAMRPPDEARQEISVQCTCNIPLYLCICTNRNYIYPIRNPFLSEIHSSENRLPVLEVVHCLLLPVHVRVSIVLILSVEIGELSRSGRQVHLHHVDSLGLSDDYHVSRGSYVVCLRGDLRLYPM
jgi:hypothetical protein